MKCVQSDFMIHQPSLFSTSLRVGAILVTVAHGALADVKPNPLISEGMVLQQKAHATLWGAADPGERVTVEFRGAQAGAVTQPDGKWRLQVDSKGAGGPFPMTIHGKNTIRYEDVLVGEVWVCSGQSNMEWALGRSAGGLEAVASSSNSQLRLCTIPHNTQMTPQEEVATKWVVSGSANTKYFSAIAYWFGSKLQKELGVPVGIINCSYGGTTIQAWMPLDALRNGPWPQDKATDITLSKADYDIRKAKLQPLMDRYLEEKAKATKEKTAMPAIPQGWPGDFRGPSVIWNGEVVPLLKYTVRGVAWYQGESNAYVGVANTYSALLPTLINEWRTGWAQPDLPFIVFQLAPNRKPQTDPNETSGIAVVQEAELKTCQTVPNTALIVTMDLGEPNVHYLNKEPAGERAMKAALSLAYGRDVEYRGPVFQTAKSEGGKMVVHFSHTGGQLISKGGPLTGFTVAGADQKFAFAEARIEGDCVIVSNAQVPAPVAVRYGWADLPKVNLFSKEGLPASPFRSDSWTLPGGH